MGHSLDNPFQDDYSLVPNHELQVGDHLHRGRHLLLIMHPP